MISSSSWYVREYRRYHRTHSRMITSSKCRPRNSAGRLRVTLHRTRSAQAAFATEPIEVLTLRGLATYYVLFFLHLFFLHLETRRVTSVLHLPPYGSLDDAD